MEFPNRWKDNVVRYQKPSPEFIKVGENGKRLSSCCISCSFRL